MSSWSRRIRSAAHLRAQRAQVVARAMVRGGLRRVDAQPADRDRTPIFLVGCHRSGTSLVRRVVDCHSRIACPAETLFMEHLAAAVAAPDAPDGLRAIGVTTDQLGIQLQGLIRGHMERYVQQKGKRRWADKTPTLVHQLDGIDLIFERQAQYVAILRDGMDVATSLGGSDPLWWQLGHHVQLHGDPYVAAAAYWRDLNVKLLDFADRHADRVHILRYEQLVTDPEGRLRALFSFLGEPWEPAVLDFNGKLHDGGLEDHRVSATTRFEDNSGKHRRLPLALQARMWEVVRPVMLRAGYDDRSYV